MTLPCLLALGLGACNAARVVPDATPAAPALRAQAAQRAGLDVATLQESPTPVQAAIRALLAEPLTEASAVRIAVLNNPSVWLAHEDLGIARAELMQAGLLSNPVLSGEVTFFSPGTGVALGLAQPFLDLFLVPLRRREASAHLRAAEARLTRELLGLVYEVRRTLLLQQAAARLVSLRGDALKAAVASRELMEQLYEAGNVPVARVTGERLGEARAQADLAEAEAGAREARRVLDALLGLRHGDVSWSVAGTLADDVGVALDGAEACQQALDASLDLAEARAHVAAAAGHARLVWQRTALPLLDVGGALDRDHEGGAVGVGPTVRVALPIFDQGQGKRAGAASDLRRRMVLLRATCTEVVSAARTFETRSADWTARARHQRERILPLQSRVVMETLQSYNAMQIGAFAVLDARRQYVDAERAHVETLREAWLARLDLEELRAGRLNPARLAAAATTARAPAALPRGGH